MIKFHLKKLLEAAHGNMELDVTCQIDPGDFVVIYGPSGSGKTSILRMISGLFKPDHGHITLNGATWFDSENNINIKPQNRKIGFVWQEYALFPNMTVKENLIFALEKGQDPSIVDQLIATVELDNLQSRKPKNLSGGQKQRVALARALVRRPSILLLDEPLSALDENMRIKMQNFLLKVHQKFELTTILVSHDLGEIFRLAEKIFVLKNGKFVKQGTPETVFSYQNISGKYRITGTIVKIDENDVVFVISVLIGNQVIKVIATTDERKTLAPGDKVVVISKAFNPIILKLDD